MSDKTVLGGSKIVSIAWEERMDDLNGEISDRVINFARRIERSVIAAAQLQVEAVLPKVGEHWLIKIKGAQTCSEVVIVETTEKTILFRDFNRYTYSPSVRYLISDVELIEIYKPASVMEQKGTA